MALTVRQQASYWGIAAAILFALLWGLGNVILPFLVGGAWAAPGGELWIVGPDDEVGAGPGVTAHSARPAAEVR